MFCALGGHLDRDAKERLPGLGAHAPIIPKRHRE
jgi:hypothetical protein